MAMDVAGAKSSLKADINVTPLADVTLVLVIIMMLLSPPSHGGGPVALPEAANSMEKPDTPDQTVISIDSRGHFYVNAFPVVPDDLVARVQRSLDDRKDKMVYMKADKDARYSAIMGAMDALRRGQIENVALITEPKQPLADSTAGRGR